MTFLNVLRHSKTNGSTLKDFTPKFPLYKEITVFLFIYQSIPNSIFTKIRLYKIMRTENLNYLIMPNNLFFTYSTLKKIIEIKHFRQLI